ncbi:MAG: hypothetical protein QF886_13800, partial [Planctomycetota bacterium]|nr:hypothetical protein [Planctomycetota bacterium]
MKTRHDLILCLPTIACFHFAAPSSGELNLATIFGENMILQREMPVPIWGIGAPGEKIFMTFAGQEKSVIAGPSGEWLIRLNPMPASNKQREMVVSCPGVKTRPIVLKGVLVGDVWLVLMNGGSDRLENVGFGLPHPVNRYTAMDFRGQKPDSRPQKKYGKQRAWVPSGHKWGNDGLSYFFSQRLHRELDVPIGVIRLLTGNLDSIIPRSGLRAVPELEDQSDTVESRFPSTPKGRKVFGAWLQDAKAWAGKMRQSFEQNQEVVPSLPPVAPSSADLNWSTPTVVYNTVINPLVPFGVRGVVMSSADTNSDDSLYVQKIKALQIGLSEKFGQPELPLCFTQRGLSNFYSLDSLATDLDLDAWAGHRDRQRRAAAATG